MDATAKVARLADAEPVSFGPLAEYRKLTGDDGLPVFTGVQTCRPGYQTPLHSHPYVEYLFVLEGAAEAWLDAEAHRPVRLNAGDMIALPAGVPHGISQRRGWRAAAAGHSLLADADREPDCGKGRRSVVTPPSKVMISRSAGALA